MKKLTAGIFTALLGLVTVNAANAAIPSTTYVDTKIATAQTAAQKYADDQDALLKSAYEAADATTLQSAKDYTDVLKNGQVATNANAIGTVANLTTNEKTNTVAAINEINAAYKAADEATLTSANAYTDAEIKELNDSLTSTGTNVGALSNSLEALEGRVDTAEGEIDTLQSEMDAVELKAAANETAIATLNGGETVEGSVAKAEADANDYTDSAIANLSTVYDAFGSAAAAESSAKAHAESEADAAQSAAETYAKNYADGLATNYDAAGSAATAESNAKAYADQAEADAVASAKSYADTELAKKVDKTGHAASQVVITDSTGAIATAAQIPNTQVSGLGDLATKSTIADADVAADAAIAQSKIAGLEDALANTTPKVTARGEAGTYVLTAIVSDSGATSYQWEQIERPTTGGEG